MKGKDKLKKLPIGIQNFETLIKGGFVYVDKTRHIFSMVSESMFYFLAQPRRSGKKIVLMGINFSTQERAIVDWRYATVAPQIE